MFGLDQACVEKTKICSDCPSGPPKCQICSDWPIGPQKTLNLFGLAPKLPFLRKYTNYVITHSPSIPVMNIFWGCLHHIYLTYRIKKRCANDLESSRKSDIQSGMCVNYIHNSAKVKIRIQSRSQTHHLSDHDIIPAAPTTAPSGHVRIPIRAHHKGLILFGHPISHESNFDQNCSDYIRQRPKFFTKSVRTVIWPRHL